MRKKFLSPVIALVGGAAGFALRKWQLTSGFEADTGLAVPGAPSALILGCFSVSMALCFFFLSRRQEPFLSWDVSFAAGRQNTLAVTALVLSAMLLLASGGVEIIAYSINNPLVPNGENFIARAASAALPPLRILFCLGALPCCFLWARAILRGQGGEESLAVLEPCLLFCVWLISVYQLRSSDPVIQSYVYEVLAIVFSLLGLYFIAGHSFGNGKPRSTVFFCLLGSYFSLVALAGPCSTADLFRHLFAVLYLLTHALLILNCPPAETPTAEAEREADENA